MLKFLHAAYYPPGQEAADTVLLYQFGDISKRRLHEMERTGRNGITNRHTSPTMAMPLFGKPTLKPDALRGRGR